MFKQIFVAMLASTAIGADYPRVNEPCSTDTNCFDDFEICTGVATDLEAGVGVCEHKDVWPFNTLEWFGNIMTLIVLLTSNFGGLGGGGALIPVAMIFYGFDTKQAIGLSNASICVASICRYIFNFNKSHPLKQGKGVLVDYNIASLMLPMIVVGATTGVMVNKILPPIIVAIVFTILLVFFTITTFRKLLKLIAAERVKFGPTSCCGKNSQAKS